MRVVRFRQRFRSAPLREGRATPSHSVRTRGRSSSGAPVRAMTMRSTPCGDRSGQVRKHSRQRRLTRFRRTASPTRRPTTRPSRDGVPGRPARATSSVKWAVPTRRVAAGPGPARTPRACAACGRGRRPWTWLERAPFDVRPSRLLLVDGRDEALPPLAAAVREHLAATRGGHAGAKAVGAGSADVVGLVRALHGWGRFRRDKRALDGASVKALPRRQRSGLAAAASTLRRVGARPRTRPNAVRVGISCAHLFGLLLVRPSRAVFYSGAGMARLNPQSARAPCDACGSLRGRVRKLLALAAARLTRSSKPSTSTASRSPGRRTTASSSFGP